MVLVTLALTIPAQAKSDKDEKHYTVKKASETQLYGDRQGTFGPAERNMIRSYLLGQEQTASQRQYKNLPPGLQKKVARGKALPPGWQKKIAAGQSLDYQVYRQGTNLPNEVLRRLPPFPVGTETLQVEDKVLLINTATRVILDAFDLIPSR
jgi:hypothetical protein